MVYGWLVRFLVLHNGLLLLYICHSIRLEQPSPLRLHFFPIFQRLHFFPIFPHFAILPYWGTYYLSLFAARYSIQYCQEQWYWWSVLPLPVPRQKATQKLPFGGGGAGRNNQTLIYYFLRSLSNCSLDFYRYNKHIYYYL